MTARELEGLNVLITGASRGIGFAIASAARRAGAIVWGIGRTEPDDLGAFHRFDSLDVTDDEQVASYFRRTDHVDLHGLVNNAGRAIPAPFLQVDPSDLDEVISLNLRAPFLVSQYAARSMIRGGGGSIVHVSSVNAHRGVNGTSAYSTTKGGIAALTRAMAVELAGNGIRVNDVAPAATDTERLRAILSDDELERRLDRIPLRDLVAVSDVADGVVFLLSSRSRFITGHSLAIDGGYLALGSM